MSIAKLSDATSSTSDAQAIEMKVLCILLLPLAFWIEKAALTANPYQLRIFVTQSNKDIVISFLVWFLFSVPPFPCDKLDLTMILDRTESIGPSLFNKMKILAADLTDRYRGYANTENVFCCLNKPLNTYVIAVALGKEANAHRGVLDRTADEVIDWTLPKGERSSNDVLNDIMNRFDFERCDGSQPGFLTIEKFGCFSTEYTDSRKNRQPAMESIENSNCWLLSNTSLQRREAFERCAWCCWKLGHKYFALDGDNGCSAASVAWKIYQGGHPDSNDYCTEKRGGSNSNVVYYLKDCQAFGLENKAIADGKMSASSERNAHHSAKHGRLFSQRAWSAGIKDAEQWLEVDLSIMGNIVNRVGTQGSGDAEEWVTVYKLLYSYRNSPVRFKFAQRLDGNSDSNTVVYHKLKRRFLARYVRFQPLSWNVWPSMRVELYFCKPGTTAVEQEPLVSYIST
ncbi:unnamed protein product [Porites evermanni]|uniref:F5/8 type C domain-containing protein n=1 Tax=Porites evermanni TaxID=104178 RepID=A0ABN8N704_9CNID|nr:unnamed protein product [Porites evermanni]